MKILRMKEDEEEEEEKEGEEYIYAPESLLASTYQIFWEASSTRL